MPSTFSIIASACLFFTPQSSRCHQSGTSLDSGLPDPKESSISAVPLRTKALVHSLLLSSSRGPALTAASIIIRGEDDCSHPHLHVHWCPHRWVNMLALVKKAGAHTHTHTGFRQSAGLSDARNDRSVISR